MSTPYKNIAIIGGVGNIGSIILRGLLSAPSLSITAFTRPGSNGTFPKADNLKVIETEYNTEALTIHLKGQDVLISVIGGMGFGAQKNMIDACVQAGVKRFFPSEFGVNGQSEASHKLTPLFAVKREILAYLVEKEKEGLTWTALIVGPILDWCIANGFAGFDLTTKRATIWDDGEVRFSCVNEASLGSSVVACLEHPTETSNKVVHISSVTPTQKEVLHALEKVTSSKWDVKHIASKEHIEASQAALAKGNFLGALELVKAVCWSNFTGLHQHFEVDEKETLLNDVLGVKPETVQDTVEHVLAGEYNGSYYV